MILAPLKTARILVIAGEHASLALPLPSEQVLPHQLAEVSGAPDVVVIGPGVQRRTSAGRQALQRWPTSKLLFVAPAAEVDKLRLSLPFIPDLAGAVVVADTATEREYAAVVTELMDVAQRDRATRGLYDHLNSQMSHLSVGRAALQQRSEQLALAERYLASVLEFAPQGLIAADLQGCVISLNDATAALLGPGWAGSERNLLDAFTQPAQGAVEAILSAAALGRSGRCEAELRSGAMVEISAAHILGRAGEIVGLSIALLDISERKRMEVALAETNRRLNAVLDNASVAIFLMDERHQCLYMNSAAERLTGYRLQETLGRPLHDVIHHTRPDGTPYALEDCPIDRAFPQNHNEQGEEVFVHKDGGFYPVAFTASPIRDDNARTVGTIIEVRDISAEKRNEAARELLMREVDHRSRNVLAIAQSIVQLTRAEQLKDYKDVVVGRIQALARAQGSLARTAWEGARLEEIVSDAIDALGSPGAYELTGPSVKLAPEQVQPLSMIVHELATNASKYGAFSSANGSLHVTWSLIQSRLALVWRERGLMNLQQPERRGFGSRLIADLTRQLQGEVTYDWSAEGLTVQLVFPADRVGGA